MAQKMTKAQKEAVTYAGDKTLLIAACAGSGKTFVLTERVRHLNEKRKVSPSRIFVGTFTRAAADEMKSRICVGDLEGAEFGHLGTLHSFGRKVLAAHYGSSFNGSRNKGSIMDGKDVTKLMGYLFAEGDTWNVLGKGIGAEYEMEVKQLHRYISRISLLKNGLVTPENYIKRTDADPGLHALWVAYEDAKKQGWYNPKLQVRHRLFDMDDMLCEAYYVLKGNPDLLASYVEQFDYLLVDEAQDCNLAQFLLIKMIASKGHLTIVGDDDQSMYSFRGACPEDFVALAKDAHVVCLDTNFRSVASIVELAASLIVQNSNRIPKDIKAHK